ncbi:IS3 family transposase [Yersinia enterocolitica]|uniref:IS3 family transposase n=1 Tax=Yersinia enterocolitica TaxID=630 RepID=UPI001C8DC956|nr:IS3 family transposase [Yersinia enterocolitica]MBX9496592.1 IS3 family transposase [Yersinia enterocolitica]
MKHPFSIRLAAVQHYLSGKATLQETARQFSVGKSPLSRWIRAFRYQGKAGLEHRLSRTYTPEFRLSVVRYVIKNRCSSAEASAHFAIPNETLIQNWMKRYREGGKEALNPSRTGPVMPKDGSKPFSEMTHAELEKELEYLRAENAYPKKAESPERGKGTQGAAEKTRIVQSLLAKHRLSCLLCAAQLARSTYYYHASKPESTTDNYVDAVKAIGSLSRRHAQRYGYRRMTIALRKEGFTLNHKTVRKLMNQHGLLSLIRRKKYRSYRADGGLASNNLLARDFTSKTSGLKWCTDVTEFRVGEKKLYLSVIQDLFNNEIISWHTAERPALPLTCKTLEKALKVKGRKEGLMLHSDQGWHYRTPMWRSMLVDAGITQSMSRKGSCLDNAVMENFFSHLKAEMYHRKKYESATDLKRDIVEYIHYYNTERISLKTDGMSPVEYRTRAERQ